MTHQEQLEIGAYLLGALPPRERSAFEAHLAQCSACRNEVADLAGIPALLGKVSLSDVSLSEVVAAPAESDSGGPSPGIRPDPGPEPSPGREPFPEPGPAPGRPGPVRRVVRLPDAATSDLAGPAPGVVRLPDPGTADPRTPLGADYRLDTGTPVPSPPSAPPPSAPPPSAAPPAATTPTAPRPARKPITAGPFSWRHRTVLLAAAAVLVILAVVGSVALLSGRHSPTATPPGTQAPAPAAPAETRTVSLLPAVAGVHGSVQIAGSGLGSLLRLSMGGVRPGQDCSLLVAGDDGTRQPVASWTANYEGDVEQLADSALQPANIRWVGVTTPDGTVLLQARLAA